MRTQTALRLQRKFLEARSEKEILEYVLQLGTESLQAPVHPLCPSTSGTVAPRAEHGKVPEIALQTWSKVYRCLKLARRVKIVGFCSAAGMCFVAR